jgi:hypothetical protein
MAACHGRSTWSLGGKAMLAPNSNQESRRRLMAVKVLHTAVWSFFAGCILAIPFFALTSRFKVAVPMIAVVAVEVLVLLLNGWKCPLTGVAAQYTPDRRDNFDIYLPEWLARYNKLLFGGLYVCGVILTALRWNAR